MRVRYKFVQDRFRRHAYAVLKLAKGVLGMSREQEFAQLIAQMTDSQLEDFLMRTLGGRSQEIAPYQPNQAVVRQAGGETPLLRLVHDQSDHSQKDQP